MRVFVKIVIALIPYICFAQEPVDVSAHLNKISDRRYNLQLDFQLAKGWHVYASSDSTLGLDPISVITNNETITVIDQSQNNNDVTRIHDPVFDGKLLTVYPTSFTIKKQLLINESIPPTLFISIKGFASNNNQFLPLDISKEVQFYANKPKDFKLSTIIVNTPSSDCGGGMDGTSSKGLLTIFLLGFGGGLLALLTPCVFPMVPVTVSYFTGKSKSKKTAVLHGLLYGASILSIYLVASVPFHLVGNLDPQTLNSIATNVWLNIFFFVIFICFALSFFGLFELTLPSSFSNLAGSKSNMGSLAGIFFMALTLVIVSFSCTGPILGSLLVGSVSSQNGAWALTSGMAGFGCALGLPFALFAIFPHWIQKLPKSGSWMNVVKKSLAFVELALAIKFLSNADLVQHWGILKREVFISLWIIIFFSLGLYLLGMFTGNKKQFHSSPVLRVVKEEQTVSISKGRIAFGTLALFFALYLTPGLTQTKYANLKLLSGFAPPFSYSIYGKENVRGKGLEPNVVNDYEKAVQLSKQEHKPILVDFTGWACVNCRKMEENVWTNHEIQKLIKEKFILVSLYVDDRKKLPSSEHTIIKTEDGGHKEIVTVGDRNAAFQSENFKQVTQPLYVILSPDEKLMNHPVGYSPDVKEYKNWLSCGYEAFMRAATR